MKFKYFDHTADVMIESYGKDLEEAFMNAAEGMFGILTDIKKVKSEKKFNFAIENKKLETLFFDFIDELIYIMDTEFVILSSFEVTITQDEIYHLKCSCYGDKAVNYDRHGDIKAPTYNEMEITCNPDDVKIRFVVDI